MDIRNKNLFLAKRLLEIIAQKPQLIVGGNGLPFKKEFVPELSYEDLIKSLKTLGRRKAIKFRHKENKLVIRKFPVDIVFNKDKLLEFVEIGQDKTYKITTRYKNNLNYVLESLSAFLQGKFLKEEVIEFSEQEMEGKYIKIAEWIADYSGIIEVIYVYRQKGDFKPSKTKKAPFADFSELPKELRIIDRPALKQLDNEIQQTAIKPYQGRVKLFLNKNAGAVWRCAGCGRFFERLTDEKKVVNYLVDFSINKFKTCHGCRERNCFTISSTGKFEAVKSLS